MGKLHELLSVENEIADAAKKILLEGKKTFNDKGHLFQGSVRHLELFDPDAVPLSDEIVSVTTTVGEKLRYMAPFIVRRIDAAFQKEVTNQEATTTLELDGLKIENVPATFLLGLEKRLKELREVYNAIPTLPPGKEYTGDSSMGREVFRTLHPETSFKTEKTIKPVVLYAATKEHPAQVEKVAESKDVGKYTKTSYFGMLSSAQKSTLIGKIDKLIEAVKRARAKANATTVRKVKCGNEIMRYLHDGIVEIS
jgi:hypothetical protein